MVGDVHSCGFSTMDSSADLRRCCAAYTIALWWPPATGRVSQTTTPTGRLFESCSWGQPAATAGLYERYSAEQRRRPPTRSRWPGCAGGSGVVLELLQLAFSIIWIGSRMSTPRWDHQVCRHPCTSALTTMLRLPHSAVPWQVVASLQRLSHESILSIPSLSH